jgi:Tfp pilus assembly protein PilV
LDNPRVTFGRPCVECREKLGNVGFGNLAIELLMKRDMIVRFGLLKTGNSEGYQVKNFKKPFGRVRAQNQQAFTLIEVMVAVCVIVVAVTTIFASMTLGFSMTESSRENLRATQIMLDKMEGVRLYNWSQVTNSAYLIPAFTNWFYETNNIGEENAAGNGVQYTGLVHVVSVPFTNAYSANMVEVDVLIGWISSGNGWYGANNVHTRTMSTYVSMNGMQNYIYNSY